MAFPRVQQAKLEQLKAVEATKIEPTTAAPVENAARMMVSMTPDPMAEARIENQTEVNTAEVEQSQLENNVNNSQEVINDDKFSELQAEIDDYKHKWKSVAGLYEKTKSERDQINSELNSLKNTVKELQEKINNSSKEDKIQDYGLDEQELNDYSQAIPTIQKIAKRMAQKEAGERIQALSNQIDELRANTTQVTQTLTNSREQAFHSQVKSHITDIDSILGTQPWSTFLEKRVPYTNITFKQALANAVNSFDVDSAVDIFKAYKPKNKSNGLATMINPAMSAGSASPVTNKEEKTILKLSDRKKASTQFIQGKITKQKMQEIQDMFAKAEKEGRIDFSA